MFCSQCGAKVTVEARFCPSCGKPVAVPAPAPKKPVTGVDDTKPLYRVKPVFIPWVTILSVLPIQLFFTVWGAGFCGGFGMVAVQAIGLPLPGWFTFVFFGCAFFFGIPILAYVSKSRTYAATEYRFYAARLEYAEGFWAAENKSIKYDKILEASLREGVFQRQYGLGTIFLSTAATGFTSGRSRSGISISDIENPQKVYAALKELMEC